MIRIFQGRDRSQFPREADAVFWLRQHMLSLLRALVAIMLGIDRLDAIFKALLRLKAFKRGDLALDCAAHRQPVLCGCILEVARPPSQSNGRWWCAR